MSGRLAFVFYLTLTVFAALPALTAHAADIAVTVTGDDRTNNGNCTLREAVIAANTDEAVDACPSGAGDDMIILEAGTYTLSVRGGGTPQAGTGDIDINQDLTIQGAGADVTTIDATGLNDRAFEIADDVTANISGVTITGGRVPRIGVGADMNGGGIRNSGNLTIIGCAFDNNTSFSGGAIQNGNGPEEATMTIQDSTISDNFVRDGGGGIQNSGGGMLVITNSTITLNSAPGGGGINNFGSININNSTIANNEATEGDGGGIRNLRAGVVTLSNTILADNDAAGDGTDCIGAIITAGSNLLGDTEGCGFTAGTGDQVNVSPDLSTFGNNGGPTRTISLDSDSLAVDGGNNSTCEATDQRGRTRPRSSADPCDIGSVEISAVVATPTPTPSVSPTPAPITCFGFTATIPGTPGNDNITGTSGRDIIHGLAGNDIINALGGNDVVCGGAGSDMINGGIGNDRLIGQFGTDTVSGGFGNDILDGNQGNDTLNGNQGNDTLTGLGGNDTLNGGFGTDNCNGGPGTDTATGCETVNSIP